MVKRKSDPGRATCGPLAVVALSHRKLRPNQRNQNISQAGLLLPQVRNSFQNSAPEPAIHLPCPISIAPDAAPAIRGAPMIARVGEFQLTTSHQMDDDAVGQLAEDIDVSVVEIGAPNLPDLVLVVVFHDDGDAGGRLILGYVDAASTARVAFCKKASCAILGRDCTSGDDGNQGEELENEPCKAGGGEKLHCV